MFGDRRQKKEALCYLVQLGAGWIFGMVMAVLVLSALFERHIYGVSSLFIGFIAGAVPVITKLGNGGIVWVVLAAGLLACKRTRKSGVILAVALAADVIVCNGILKNAVQRIRPCDVNTSVDLLIHRPTDFSFPSGHTAESFAAVSALYFAGEKKLWKPVLFLAVLIAFSRMYLYVHYPTDILGGMIVGIAMGYLASRVVYCLWRSGNE